MSKAASKDENAGEDAKLKKTRKNSVGKDAVKTKKLTNYYRNFLYFTV